MIAQPLQYKPVSLNDGGKDMDFIEFLVKTITDLEKRFDSWEA